MRRLLLYRERWISKSDFERRLALLTPRMSRFPHGSPACYLFYSMVQEKHLYLGVTMVRVTV